MNKTLLRLIGSLLLLVTVAVLAGAAALLMPNTPVFEDRRGVKLPAGSSFAAIGDSLESAGIVDRRWLFDGVAKLTGWSSQIKSGYYEFETGRSNYEIMNVLRRGLETPVRMVIRAGTRPDYLSGSLARQMAFDSTAFRRALGDPDLARSLGTDTAHLFAYMLPDTYFFYWETPPDDVIRKVKETWDAFYKKALESAPGPGLDLTPEQVMNVASIVEWESGFEPEKPTVAAVYLNRLRDRWALQADPTVQYAIIEREGSKRRLFFTDYKIDHPYNTYIHTGLPPGPVTNPSRSSVEAVLHPDTHKYYYFVAKGDGSHLFSRTLSEHRRNAQAFYRLMQQRRAEAARAEAARTP